MLRNALLGCGGIGVTPGAQIAAHRSAVLVTEGMRAVARSEGIVAGKTVDAVLIACSIPTHADLLEQAMAAGKQLPCDTPLDPSLDRVNRAADRTVLPGAGR